LGGGDAVEKKRRLSYGEGEGWGGASVGRGCVPVCPRENGSPKASNKKVTREKVAAQQCTQRVAYVQPEQGKGEKWEVATARTPFLPLGWAPSNGLGSGGHWLQPSGGDVNEARGVEKKKRPRGHSVLGTLERVARLEWDVKEGKGVGAAGVSGGKREIPTQKKASRRRCFS